MSNSGYEVSHPLNLFKSIWFNSIRKSTICDKFGKKLKMPKAKALGVLLQPGKKSSRYSAGVFVYAWIIVSLIYFLFLE